MTNQVSAKPLPDEAHVSRYCRPGAVGQDGLPLVAAFQLKGGEDYLSVNWLEYFQALDQETAITHVREAFRTKSYGVRTNGRFVVLGVKDAKEAVSAVTGRPARVDHLPLKDDPSHSGIFGYAADDLAVAAELKALVGRACVHNAT